MTSRIVSVAILLALVSAPATAQQQGGASSSNRGATGSAGGAPKPGAAASGANGLAPSGMIGGKMMLKPGQTFIGGKMSTPHGLPGLPKPR
jgi:hypothetical protein